MLVDEAKIHIKAGRGGDGAVSFRREKYVPRGGPDGGDGGDGGSVIIECSDHVHTLSDYLRQKKFEAESGARGGRAQRHGKSADDLILRVPPGTIIEDLKTNELIFDFTKSGEKVIVAKGGRGGLGNVHFKSATHQAPREFKPGTPGEEEDLKLTLKLIADVGIIGLPNAGKSTLISAISSARPKIAEYPFTTLEPNLGAVDFHDKKFVVCDIPGLIEGASKGRGLGHKFLRHIERTKNLVHLIDATSQNPKRDYKTIRDELKNFSADLSKKGEIIVLTKSDLIKEPPVNFKYDLAISAATGSNVNKLLNLIAQKLSNDR